MAIVVDRLREDEVDDWLDLLAAVAEERDGIAAEPPVDRPVRRQWVEQALVSDDAALLVARVDGRFAGQLGAELRRGIVSIGMLVARDTRGRGVGTALLDAAVEWAGAVGAHKVALEVWPHNAAALALYRRAGFVEEGRLRRHYRRSNGALWDSVAMGLVLDETSPGGPGPSS